MNNKKLKDEIILLFWLFIIGSIAGFIYEVTIVFFKKDTLNLGKV